MEDAAGYDEIAEWYDEQLRSGSLIHDLVVPTLLGLVGDISGQQICDLACGQGVVARQLAERGAVVRGIDLSTRLLAIAGREEAVLPRGIAYRHGDAQELADVGDASFDGVVCNMALMDIPDLAATVRTLPGYCGHTDGSSSRSPIPSSTPPWLGPAWSTRLLERPTARYAPTSRRGSGAVTIPTVSAARSELTIAP